MAHNMYIVSNNRPALSAVQSKLLKQEKQKQQFKQVLNFAGDCIGAISVFVILFVGLWAGAILNV
jgi:hypothetical protein